MAHKTASFYDLPATLLTPQEQLRAICRVINKVWQVVGEADILCDNLEAAQSVDNMLWIFQANAFIPHGLGAGNAVRIHYQDPWPDFCKVAVFCNLQKLPVTLPESERLVDFIPVSPVARDQARERYKQLKSLGYTLQVHALEA
ncbi:DNA polymerase III subunit chi [Acidithiobacillus marinus]|uniref:DNA polymerase III subunit chi n=1 Tax=Acidithiobacillus marinus TaxID=187490 RepID=A0A2I1DKA4_9PROT|nr:DNA polymerase III subunit chi [Acidithiobacillus marinus]